MRQPQALCVISSRVMQRDKVALQDGVQDLKSGLDPKLGFCFHSLQKKSQITPCFPSADLTLLSVDFNGFIKGPSRSSFFEKRTCYEGTKMGYLPQQ